MIQGYLAAAGRFEAFWCGATRLTVILDVDALLYA